MEKKEKVYVEPRLEIIDLEQLDVIATSGPLVNQGVAGDIDDDIDGELFK